METRMQRLEPPFKEERTASVTRSAVSSFRVTSAEKSFPAQGDALLQVSHIHRLTVAVVPPGSSERPRPLHHSQVLG